MSSGNDVGKKISGTHLAVVPPPESTAPPAEPVSSPASIPPPASVPPLPSIDPTAFRNLLRGKTSQNPYEFLNSTLRELANRLPSGAYDLQLRSDQLKLSYRVQQSAEGAPLEIGVMETRNGAQVQTLSLKYHPDGMLESSLQPARHRDPLRGPERTHHRRLRNL